MKHASVILAFALALAVASSVFASDEENFLSHNWELHRTLFKLPTGATDPKDPFFHIGRRILGAEGGEDVTAVACQDIPPPGNSYTCAQQKQWGKCGETWMTGYCLVSCGACPSSPPSPPPPSPPVACQDIPPPGNSYTCAQQKQWGKCGETWMTGYCRVSCGTCPSSPPSPPPPSPPVACQDIPPPGNSYTCAQQKQWGKCGEAWMAGYCFASCGICPALDCLKSKQVAYLILSDGESFNKAKIIWNKLNDTNVPTAVVQPTTITQVQDAVKCLSSNGVRAIIRGGGHSYEGYSLINNVATIDLRGLNGFKLSSDRQSVTIGGGSRLGPLYYEINRQAPGKALVGGVCPPVGVGGFIPGGGFGYLTRREGLACDKLVSLKMVTAKGALIEATASNTHKDLFWAHCGGGGGNFGIVVEYTLKLASVPTAVTRIQFSVTNNLADFLLYIQSTVVNRANPAIGMAIFLNKDRIDMSISYIGTVQEAENALVEAGLGPNMPFQRSSYRTKSLTWIEFVVEIAGEGSPSVRTPDDLRNLENGVSDRTFFDFRGFFVRPNNLLPKSAFEALISWIGRVQNEGTSGFVEINLLGPRGAQATIGVDQSAFAFRDALLLVQYGVKWQDPNNSKFYYNNDLQIELQRYIGSNPPAYINYLDAGQTTESYYGSAWSRLKQVKGIYDPDNYFRNPKSIPLA